MRAECEDLLAIVDGVAPDVGCVVTMSVYDIDVVAFNGVLTGGVEVVVADDVTPGSTVQTSK